MIDITGDGAFGFNVAELDTAVRYGISVVHVIHDNQAWGVIAQSQKRLGFELGTSLEGTDDAAIARGFGAHGEHVTSVDEVAPALARALAVGGPAVIDARVRLNEPRYAALRRDGPPALSHPQRRRSATRRRRRLCRVGRVWRVAGGRERIPGVSV